MGAKRRRGAGSAYNCHGLTLAGKHGWVGCIRPPEQGLSLQFELPDLLALHAAHEAEDEVTRLLGAVGYTCRARLDLKHGRLSLGAVDVVAGDLVLYRSYRATEDVYRLTHSALVVHVETNKDEVVDVRLLSKFGLLGEYVHSIRARPKLLGDSVEIWSDREETWSRED